MSARLVGNDATVMFSVIQGTPIRGSILSKNIYDQTCKRLIARGLLSIDGGLHATSAGLAAFKKWSGT